MTTIIPLPPVKGPKPASPRFQPTHHLSRSLVGAWLLTEGGGETIWSHDLTRQSGSLISMDAATDWVRGSCGWALDFDGSNDGVNLTGMDTIHGEDQATLAAWVKVGTASGAICGSLNATSSEAFIRWTVNFDPSSGSNDAGETQLYLRTNSNQNLIGGWAFDSGLSDDEWHLLTVGWDWPNGTIEMSIDGEILGPITYTAQNTKGTTTALSSAFSLGRYNHATPGNHLTGQISSFCAWRRRLNASEIRQLYCDPYAMFRPRVYVPLEAAAPSGYTPPQGLNQGITGRLHTIENGWTT